MIMEKFHDPSLGCVQDHLDDSAFQLIGLPLPAWFINSDHKLLFENKRSHWDTIVDKFPLHVAPGLDSILSTASPPSLDIFQTLPPAEPNTWGVYAVTLVRASSIPKLYIGSGTSVDGRVKSRCNAYISGSGPFSKHVRKALDDGYSIDTIGMLCSTPLPKHNPEHVPALRSRILVLESVFTIIFCASIPWVTDDAFIRNFFPWSRQDVPWSPACNHLSLSESVKADLQLTDAERISAALAVAQRGREKTQRHRDRERAKDEEKFRQTRRDQNKSWSAANPGAVNKMAADVRHRARDAQRFRCEVCEHNFASQYYLDEHKTRQVHLDAVKNGRKILKPVSQAGLNKRQRDDAGRESKEFYCPLCETSLPNATGLKRHNLGKKHNKRASQVAEAGSITASSSTSYSI